MTKMHVITVTAALALAGGVALAQDTSNNWLDTHLSLDRSAPQKFAAHELSLDVFGSYWTGEGGAGTVFQQSIRNGYWGGGVGMNYFFLPFAGVEADVNFSDHSGRIVDSALGNFVLRLPIESAGVAPYIFGGAGRVMSFGDHWGADAGVGLDFRFNNKTGLFAEARYLWVDESSDRLMLRTGLRFVF